MTWVPADEVRSVDPEAQRRAEGWIRRADWSPRAGGLAPRNPGPLLVPGWFPSSTPCPTPRLLSHEPDGAPGDLWRCPECGTLWAVAEHPDPHGRMATWELLGYWRQVAYRRGWWKP